MSTATFNLNKVWEAALKLLKNEIPASSYQAWVKTANLASVDGSKVVLEVRNEFSKNLIIQNYEKKISDSLQVAIGKPVSLIVEVNSDIKPDGYIPSIASISEENKHNPSRDQLVGAAAQINTFQKQEPGLNPKFSFSNF
ncbi:MAG TPA: DnaA N-terminal domain-containing protein, partial [Vampirovibrionales bacterium]